MPHVVALRNSKERKHNLFKCEVQKQKKAESVEVLDKGPTTNIFMIYFL